MLKTRPVHTEDESFLFELYASTRQSELLAWGWDDAMQQNFLRMQWNAQRMGYSHQYPGADHLVILWGDQRAGRLYIFRNNLEIRLVDIALLPAFYNQGIGSSLLQDLQRQAQAADLPLRLRVLKNNPARRLYERLQFATTDEDEMYLRMEWRAGDNAFKNL
jgi:ribosomal protein S18 acetylase RimI-like enzyme